MIMMMIMENNDQEQERTVSKFNQRVWETKKKNNQLQSHLQMIQKKNRVPSFIHHLQDPL